MKTIAAAWKSQRARRIRAFIILFFMGLFLIWSGFHGLRMMFLPSYYFGLLFWLVLMLPLFGVNIWKQNASEADAVPIWDGTGEELYSPELQQAIEAVTSSNTPETRKTLYQLLLTCTYCLPTSGPADGETQSFTLTQNEDGESVLPAFTDPNALKRWISNSHSMLVMPAAKLFELAAANDFAEILINPAGPAGGKLTRADYLCLSRGELPY